MKNILYLLLCLVIVTGCTGKKQRPTGNSNDKLSGSIQISGAFALYPIVVRWAEEFKKIHPNVQIDISGGGAGKGITDVLTGMVDIGMSSRDLQPEEIQRGAYPFTVLRDAVVVITNAHNPQLALLKQRGLEKRTAVDLWNDRLDTWGQVFHTDSSIPVHVYTRSDACGAGETFAAWIGMKQEDLGGTAVYGDPGIASAIQRDKVGIGYSNLGYVYDLTNKRPQPDLAVVPLDLNNDGKISEEENFYGTITQLGEAIRQGKYPSPPARDLFLITKGKPDNPLVIAFLKYVYAKGQSIGGEAGYVPLAKDILEKQKAKLK